MTLSYDAPAAVHPQDVPVIQYVAGWQRHDAARDALGVREPPVRVPLPRDYLSVSGSSNFSIDQIRALVAIVHDPASRSLVR
jgi:hypothetical protein